ncbi:unnamed protein product, partial [Polarella glacialis]
EKCLDVKDGLGKNGAHLQIWDCVKGQASMTFSWDQADGLLRWKKDPRFCVDIRDHKATNGNYAQIWECDQVASKATFAVDPTGVGRIIWSLHPEQCLDVRDKNWVNGNYIQIWQCIGPDMDQIWMFGIVPAMPPPPTPLPLPTTPSKHEGTIRWATHPEKCFDVKDSLAQDGNRMDIWDCVKDQASMQFTWDSADGKIH